MTNNTIGRGSRKSEPKVAYNKRTWRLSTKSTWLLISFSPHERLHNEQPASSHAVMTTESVLLLMREADDVATGEETKRGWKQKCTTQATATSSEGRAGQLIGRSLVLNPQLGP